MPLNRLDADNKFHLDKIIGQSAPLMDVLGTVSRIAPTNASVLITGESGTGKELIAEAIHTNSSRAKEPFVKVNLGGLSQSLFESEMFGHKKGAFTDAYIDRTGRFEMANKGTIFLDEIGDLELSCQVKLLRVLQDQTFEVLGDSRPRKVDIRVVSATNRNLREMVVERMFREDLFYRINLITVHLPALRERKDDIPLLVRYFADKQSEINGLPTVRFSSEALTFLQKLPYPGNIRELKNLVERTILVSGKAVLEASDFESQCFHTMLSAKAEAASSLEGLTLDELEKQTILQALKTHAGNLSHVATALGIAVVCIGNHYLSCFLYGIGFPVLLGGRTRTSDGSLFVCVLSPYHQAASYHWERYGAVEGTGFQFPSEPCGTEGGRSYCRYIQQDDGTVEERTTAFKGTESFSGSADQCFTDGSDYVESR